VLVYPDDSNEPLGLKNDTNSLYLVREAEFDEWSTVTEDLTEIADSYWGEEFMRDQAVDTVQLQVHTRNGATAELYFDSLQKDLEMSNQDVYCIQAKQLARSSTPKLQMVPGEELNGDNHLFSLNIPGDRYILNLQVGLMGRQSTLKTIITQAFTSAWRTHSSQTHSLSWQWTQTITWTWLTFTKTRKASS
jgi:hypothetical protein